MRAIPLNTFFYGLRTTIYYLLTTYPMVLLIALATFVATFLGGLLALRFKDRPHLIGGFSAGAVVAVALLDLLPEAIELGESMYEVSTLTSVMAGGFLIYLLLDRFAVLHTHVHEEGEAHQHRGILGAGSLVLHSFLDGLAIGLAFQVSIEVGVIVAVAVLVHDFSDGINTVSLILKNGGSRRRAYAWLAADALAPAFGVLIGMWFVLPATTLALLLALFGGFFLYIGASELLPESHHAHPTYWTTIMTVLGMLVMYVAISIAGV